MPIRGEEEQKEGKKSEGCSREYVFFAYATSFNGEGERKNVDYDISFGVVVGSVPLAVCMG
jgi:hypothetical protein